MVSDDPQASQAEPTEEEVQSRDLLDLSPDEARLHFLKQESYITLDLPTYFKFDTLLATIDSILDTDERFIYKTAQRHESVNHTVLTTQVGRYLWRPIDLIHPALYVSLVRNITEIHGRFLTVRDCLTHQFVQLVYRQRIPRNFQGQIPMSTCGNRR